MFVLLSVACGVEEFSLEVLHLVAGFDHPYAEVGHPSAEVGCLWPPLMPVASIFRSCKLTQKTAGAGSYLYILEIMSQTLYLTILLSHFCLSQTEHTHHGHLQLCHFHLHLLPAAICSLDLGPHCL